jgi:hypothetical protein
MLPERCASRYMPHYMPSIRADARAQQRACSTDTRTRYTAIHATDTHHEGSYKDPVRDAGPCVAGPGDVPGAGRRVGKTGTLAQARGRSVQPLACSHISPALVIANGSTWLAWSRSAPPARALLPDMQADAQCLTCSNTLSAGVLVASVVASATASRGLVRGPQGPRCPAVRLRYPAVEGCASGPELALPAQWKAAHPGLPLEASLDRALGAFANRCIPVLPGAELLEAPMTTTDLVSLGAHRSRGGSSDPNEAFNVGQTVRANDGVHPPRYAGRLGVVLEVRLVGPGLIEVGVDLSSHGRSTWFAPSELTPQPLGGAPQPRSATDRTKTLLTSRRP